MDWFDYTCGTTPWTRGGYEIAIFHDSVDGCLTQAIPASEPEPGRGRNRGPDLDALARAALDRAIALAGLPELTLAPSELGLTGMETYVWLDDAPGPIAASAGAGGVSVTAQASPARYTWDFGDGSDLVTSHPGRPWTRSRPGSIDHIYESGSGVAIRPPPAR